MDNGDWRARARSSFTYIGLALAAVSIIVIVALVLTLRPTPGAAPLSLHGAANGPFDNNTLITVNPLANVSCISGQQVLLCSFVDGKARCRNPVCSSVSGVLGPTNSLTINGTYPSIEIDRVGPGGMCGDPLAEKQCSVRFDIYGRIRNATNVSSLFGVPITNSTTITGTTGSPELKAAFTAFTCTGGAVTCQMGNDQYGRGSLLRDGPTILTDTTVFGGDFTGVASNLQLSSSGVVPGCYGSVSNNSITLPMPCINSGGRVISITTRTAAFVQTNGTLVITGTANQTTIAALGPKVFELHTIQNNDKEADLQFKRILLSSSTPLTVNSSNSTYTLALLGTTGTASTPLLGVFDTANPSGVPELQLGIFNETNGSGTLLHPFVAFGTALEPTTNTWVASRPNTTGFVIYDPHAGGSLYFSATSNATSGNQGVLLDVDIGRMTRSKMTAFTPLQVGPDSVLPLVFGFDTGIRISSPGPDNDYIGLSSLFTPSTSIYPRYQLVTNSILGHTYQLYEAYAPLDGEFTASSNVSDVGILEFNNDKFTFSLVPTPGAGNPIPGVKISVDITTDQVSVDHSVFIGNHQTGNVHGVSLVTIPIPSTPQDGSHDMSLGFGLYRSDATTWTVGATDSATYALWTFQGAFSIIRSPVAAQMQTVIPDVLAAFTDVDAFLYLRSKLAGPNADIWGFLGSAPATPQWQIYSPAPSQQSILLDAWINPLTGSPAWTDSVREGIQIRNNGSTLSFERLTSNNIGSGGFDAQQELMTLSGGGMSFYLLGATTGLMGFQVALPFASVAILTQIFGASFAADGTAISGVLGGTQKIWATAFVGGTWEVCRYNNPGLGLPVGSPVDCPISISGTTGAMTFTSLEVSFQSTITFGSNPEMSTGPLHVDSGGIGSGTPMIGGHILLSQAGAFGGSLIESSVVLPELDSARQQFNLLQLDTSNCGVQSMGIGIAVLYQRVGDIIQIQTFFGQPLIVQDNLQKPPCNSVTNAASVFIALNDSLAERFPPPPEEMCFITMGLHGNLRVMYLACYLPTGGGGQIFVQISLDGDTFDAFDQGGGGYHLPQLMTWRYNRNS